MICKMLTSILGLDPLCQQRQPPTRPLVTVSGHCPMSVPGGNHSGLKLLFQGHLSRGIVPLQYYYCPHFAVEGTVAQRDEVNC